MGSVHPLGTLNFSSLEIRLDMTNFIPCLTLIFFDSTKILASQSYVIERNVVQSNHLKLCSTWSFICDIFQMSDITVSHKILKYPAVSVWVCCSAQYTIWELRLLSKDQNTKGTCIPLLHLSVFMPKVTFTDKIRSVWGL